MPVGIVFYEISLRSLIFDATGKGPDAITFKRFHKVWPNHSGPEIPGA